MPVSVLYIQTEVRHGRAVSFKFHLQEPTQRSFLELLQQLKKNNKRELTVLLLGASPHSGYAQIQF